MLRSTNPTVRVILVILEQSECQLRGCESIGFRPNGAEKDFFTTSERWVAGSKSSWPREVPVGATLALTPRHPSARRSRRLVVCLP